MQRHYLEEDLALICTYFPGARAVALRTPFDLTDHAPRPAEPAEAFRDNEPNGHWYGNPLWSR